jgi:FemAB-related protein (PEP-CTERM system-associated)
MKTRISGTSDQARIEEFLTRTDSATSYHRPAWGSIIEDCFGHRFIGLICEEGDGSIRGVLPLVHMKSRLFGNFIVSMPYFNYGGVCATGSRAAESMLRTAVEIARDLGAEHIELRQQENLNNGMAVKTSKVSMRLPLRKNPKELWDSFPSKLRSQIRIPMRKGMKIRVGKVEELDGFYEVFSINMRDLGTPVYPKGFFRSILDRFRETTWVATVSMGSAPVAAGILAGYKDRIEVPWASSIRKYNPLSPNMLLYWTILEFASRQGYSVFDFGRSTAGEGTYRFKEQWGAKPVPMYWHYWVRPGASMPDLTNRNPKYRLAIEAWKRLPVPVTRILGPPIVKNIP